MDPKQKMLEMAGSRGKVLVPAVIYEQGLAQSRTLLQGLARALYRKERLSALKLALIGYDHDVTSLYDKLCYSGAMTVLVRCLERSLTSLKIHWVEVYQMCQLVEMTFRCSDAAAVHCLESTGTDLVVLLFSVLLRDDASRDGESCVRAVLKRVAGLDLSLSKVEQSGRLLLFLEQMALLENDVIVSVEALSILAGLTNHPESKVFVMESRTFLDSITRCNKMNSEEREMQHQMARILQNLTSHGHNKVKMTKQVVLEQIVGWTSVEQRVKTRGQAIEALKHISVDARAKLLIVTFEGGRVLKSLLKSADDPTLQPSVMETLLSFTCHCTASSIANYPHMLKTLIVVASSDDGKSMEKAAQTIKRLATHVSVSDKGYRALFDALLSLSGSPERRVRHWMAKAFLEQSRQSGCSFLLVRSAEAMKTLTELARDTSHDVRDPAIEALLALSASQSNVKRLSLDSNALETLVEAVFASITDVDDRRTLGRNAVLAILNLTSNRSARKRAAKQSGIVACLSQYGISDDEDEELKEAALHGVILLSPLM